MELVSSLPCQLGELLKQTESVRDLTFADHVDQFYACHDRCGRSERFEIQHGSDPSIDNTVILFNDVIEIFASDHVDLDRTTRALQHFVDRLDASCVGTGFVDDDLAW